MRLMIVEDNRTNLLVLKGILQKFEDCEVEAYLNPVEALARLFEQRFDLVLVDYLMPEMDGRTFIAEARSHPEYQHVPIVMITADGNRQTRIEAITAGATDFLNKPVDPVELKARIGNLLLLRRQQRELAQHAQYLMAEVARATKSIVDQEEEIIARLSRALDYRDNDTGEHTSRVASVCLLLAEELNLPANLCRNIFLAAPLHDIGKVAIPDAVLLKPGRLTPEETQTMRRHVNIGADILSDGTSELVQVASRIAATHHERWDGTGYPNRLHGEDIPIEGRIVAVADVFDALCSARPYKPAWPLEQSRAEIQRGAGTQFDPACVAAFERRWADVEVIYASLKAAPLVAVA